MNYEKQVLTTENEKARGLRRFLSLRLPRSSLLKVPNHEVGRLQERWALLMYFRSPDPGRPTSECWHRFPLRVALAVNAAQHDHPRRGWKNAETVCGPHHTLERVVTVGSDDGQNDSHICHTRSNLDTCVETKGYEVEKVGVCASSHS